jgi:hypothetical protein
MIFQTIYESNQIVRIFNESNFKQWFKFETAYLFQIKLVRNKFQIKLEHKSVHSCSICLQPYSCGLIAPNFNSGQTFELKTKTLRATLT